MLTKILDKHEKFARYERCPKSFTLPDGASNSRGIVGSLRAWDRAWRAATSSASAASATRWSGPPTTRTPSQRPRPRQPGRPLPSEQTGKNGRKIWLFRYFWQAVGSNDKCTYFIFIRKPLDGATYRGWIGQIELNGKWDRSCHSECIEAF